ncbi:hypothetical protein M438DRAFT_171875 [Aureobasidium pullulans EXF-150]|uniref:Uncharacterized protein n=1 Tax=Aureobasidium pullulans EXF-150 TaxID=1043002 RepID=A0A074X905_AURPU|nr:uncharacterized protein M438DRAFT_171875 [Aureobasidium pullulans EXF-150]KEQ78547.1 hypothetical protein M438DRAFT_171875 [Aureobasidium pullulans EXF-150]
MTVESSEIPLQTVLAVDEIEKPHPYAVSARDEDQPELRLDWRQAREPTKVCSTAGSPLQTHAVPSEQLRLSPANPCIDQDQGQQEGRTRLNFDGLNQVLNLGVPRAEQRTVDTRSMYDNTPSHSFTNSERSNIPTMTSCKMLPSFMCSEEGPQEDVSPEYLHLSRSIVLRQRMLAYGEIRQDVLWGH